MQFFEMLLVALNTFFLVVLMYGGLWRRSLAVLSAAFSLAVVTLQLMFEGERFQMGPAYFITFVLILHAAIRMNRNIPARRAPIKRSKLRAVGIPVAALLCGLLTALPPVVLPVFSFAKPGGSYSVGTVQYHWVDPSRKESYVSFPGDRRALNIQIWYPADGAKGKPAAPYATDLPVIADALGKRYGIPKHLFDYIRLVKTYAYQEPAASTRKPAYPVIIFSHGLPGSRYTSTFQTVELASHGFIVVAIEHTLSSFTTVFPGSYYIGVARNQPKPTDISAWDEMIENVWMKDARFVLDQLEALNRNDEKGLLTGTLDLSRIGMLGHSFGGANAVQMLLGDRRVKAAINMDGTFFGKGDLSDGLPGPFLLMSSDTPSQPDSGGAEPTDRQLAAINLRREQYEKLARQIPQRKQEALRNGGEELIVPHATHLSFCDFYLWFPVMVWMNGQTENPRHTHRVINDATVAFFKKHLDQE